MSTRLWKLTRDSYQQSTSVYVLSLMTACQVPRCVHQQRCRKKTMRHSSLRQLSLPSFLPSCCLCFSWSEMHLFVSVFLVIIYIFYNLLMEKRKKKEQKKSSFMLSAQSSSLTMHLFLSSSFREWLRKWFYCIVTFSLNSPLQSSGVR